MVVRTSRLRSFDPSVRTVCVVMRWMSGTSAGRLAFAGLLVLLVVDALLVALALRPDAAGAAAQTPTPVVVVTSSPTKTAAPVVQPAPLREVIAAVDGKRA